MSSIKITEASQVRKLEACSKPKTIALCHGCFDILHHGHLLHLQAAKKMADLLVVSVTADEFVNKGPGRPVFNLQQRMEMLAALDVVDWVVPSRGESSALVIEAIEPDFYVKGFEYSDRPDPTGKIDYEKTMTELHGGKLVFTNEMVSSSTSLIKSIHNLFFTRMKRTKVLVIGEAITDVYCRVYCTGVTKKHGTPVHRIIDTREDHGGASATFGHVQNFSDYAQLMSQGPNAAIVKTRYIIDDQTRVFRTSYIPEDLIRASSATMAAHIYNTWNPNMVIVNDFGHGFITDGMIEALRALKRNDVFIAVNAQINTSAPKNLVTKFDAYLPDYVCVNIVEAQQALIAMDPEIATMTSWNDVPHTEIAQRLSKLFQGAIVAVTDGADATFLACGDKVARCRPPKVKVEDPTGAGDAFLALSSLAAYVQAPLETIGAIGNAAGAAKCLIPGNSRSVSRADLEAYL